MHRSVVLIKLNCLILRNNKCGLLMATVLGSHCHLLHPPPTPSSSPVLIYLPPFPSSFSSHALFLIFSSYLPWRNTHLASDNLSSLRVWHGVTRTHAPASCNSVSFSGADYSRTPAQVIFPCFIRARSDRGGEWLLAVYHLSCSSCFVERKNTYQIHTHWTVPLSIQPRFITQTLPHYVSLDSLWSLCKPSSHFKEIWVWKLTLECLIWPESPVQGWLHVAHKWLVPG